MEMVLWNGDVSLAKMHVLGKAVLDDDTVARADIYPPVLSDGKIILSVIVLLNNRLLEIG